MDSPQRRLSRSERNAKEYKETIHEIDEMLKFIEDNVDDIKAAFAAHDYGGEGRVPTCRLHKILRSMGFNPTEEEVFEMILAVDKDKDGYIDFIEFLEMMKDIWGVVDKTLLEAFSMFEDNTGALEIGGMKELLFEFSDKEDLQEMLTSLKVNDEGHVDVSQVVRALTE